MSIPPDAPPVVKSKTDPLEQAHGIVEKWKRTPPPGFSRDELLGCFPTVLVLCGTVASLVLFFSGCSGLNHGYPGWFSIGLAFVVGPLLWGVAVIIHLLNQRLSRRMKGTVSWPPYKRRC
jgi:hypothetical protein